MEKEMLPTGLVSRRVRALVDSIEDLERFARFLERGEIDPSDAVVASGLGSLHARLERVVEDAQAARGLVGFYVRHGRDAA